MGIGAYLNRLGQRVIQMVNGPMILTGFGALHKLPSSSAPMLLLAQTESPSSKTCFKYRTEIPSDEITPPPNASPVRRERVLKGALNKLLGKSVYSSQDQLGGPQVMVPNGVTHKLVQSDQEGVSAILDWLSFTPKDASRAAVGSGVSLFPSRRPAPFCSPDSRARFRSRVPSRRARRTPSPCPRCWTPPTPWSAT